MVSFLIDANLPYYFECWKTSEYVHLKDINDEWSDRQVWEYAMKNNLTIVTKDSDFSNRILMQNPPPKVIHIKFGNLKMKEFNEVISRFWKKVIKMNRRYKLINVFQDRIEGIN